jgi:hypothetical protein
MDRSRGAAPPAVPLRETSRRAAEPARRGRSPAFNGGGGGRTSGLGRIVRSAAEELGAQPGCTAATAGVAVNAVEAGPAARVFRPRPCAATISGEMEPKTRLRPAAGGGEKLVAGLGGVEGEGGRRNWVAAAAWNDRARGWGWVSLSHS